jgi:hypothetical protein
MGGQLPREYAGMNVRTILAQAVKKGDAKGAGKAPTDVYATFVVPGGLFISASGPREPRAYDH